MKKYDSYKDSGVEWIGEIPEHWTVGKIKYSDLVIMGQSPLSDECNSEGKGLPFLQGNAEFGELFPTPKLYCETANKSAEINDVLLSVRAPVGAINISNQKVGIGRGLCAVRPIKSNSKFIYYWLLKSVEELDSISTGSTFKAVNLDDVKSLNFPIIGNSEQTAIANYLDQKTTQIDDLIAKKERLIQLLEEERTAIINKAVTKGLDPTVPMKDSGIEWLGEIPAHWEIKKLKQIFNSSKGLTITKENLESEGIPCVNYGEIHSKFGFEVDIDKHQLKCVNPSYLESDYKSLIQTGDFVFADTSEDVSGAGNFTYLKSNHEIFAGYHTIILRALVDIESRYFAYQFDSIPYRTQIRQSVKGIKVFSITQGILKNTSLWVPPIDEQKQIIEFLDIETNRIVSLKNSAIKEIELLKEFKTALISEVVTGKIDVRNEKLN